MKRVALVRLSAMGDLVQSLGAAQALRAIRPDMELHFVTQRPYVGLLEGLGFQSVVAHDRRGGLRALGRTAATLRGLDLDLAVDLQGNWKSALVTRLSGAPKRWGAAAGQRQEPGSGLLLNRRIQVDGPLHPAAVATALLRELEPRLMENRARLVATPEEIAAAAAQVLGAGIDPRHRFSVFLVSDPADIRSWPVTSMQQQAAAGADPVLWLRGPAERRVDLPAGVPVLDHPAGAVRALVALGCLVRDLGGRVLGPDQGPAHVMTATGATTLVFYGPQDPARTAPPGAAVLVRGDGPDCVPCRRRRCRHPAGPVCMAFTESSARPGD